MLNIVEDMKHKQILKKMINCSQLFFGSFLLSFAEQKFKCILDYKN